MERLKWPDANILKTSAVQTWIYENLFDQDAVRSRPPGRYQFRVLKKLVSIIEGAIDDPGEDVCRFHSLLLFYSTFTAIGWHFSKYMYILILYFIFCGQEISDNLMSLLSSLLSSNLPPESISAQQKAFVTYTYSTRPTDGPASSNELPVTLLESRAVISSSGTTGLRTWEAALHLGNFLISESGNEIIRGKNVLELGAGTGLLSILCAKYLEAGRVIATDGDEAVVDAIKTNIFINELDIPEGSSTRGSIESAALKWGWPLQATAFEEDYGVGALDVVLGADVTYDNSGIPLLVSTLRELFDLKSSVQVVIAASIRNEKTFETFVNACSRNRFSTEDINFPTIPEDLQAGPFYPTTTPIRILRITRFEGPRDTFSV